MVEVVIPASIIVNPIPVHVVKNFYKTSPTCCFPKTTIVNVLNDPAGGSVHFCDTPFAIIPILSIKIKAAMFIRGHASTTVVPRPAIDGDTIIVNGEVEWAQAKNKT
jgi:hypothetical protein